MFKEDGMYGYLTFYVHVLWVRFLFYFKNCFRIFRGTGFIKVGNDKVVVFWGKRRIYRKRRVLTTSRLYAMLRLFDLPVAGRYQQYSTRKNFSFYNACQVIKSSLIFYGVDFYRPNFGRLSKTFRFYKTFSTFEIRGCQAQHKVFGIWKRSAISTDLDFQPGIIRRLDGEHCQKKTFFAKNGESSL